MQISTRAMLGLCLTLLLAYVSADCPNSCSGHGSCGDNNRCLCYSNWQNADCSERTCGFGVSWLTGEYAECSDKGSCDRKNGECKCDTGFEGQACGRMQCLNGCSGHGSCAPSAADSRVMGCTCDVGYTGTDCSSRLCPVGDDPLTTVTYIGNTGQVQGDEVQQIEVALGTASSGGQTYTIGGQFTLTYNDAYGGSWTTRPMTIVDDSSDSSQDLEDLLESLPNQVIPDVTVTTGTQDSTTNTFLVTFASGSNSGDQNSLDCNIGGCDLDGCQPRYTGLTRKIKNYFPWGDTNTVTSSGTAGSSASTGTEVTFNKEAKIFESAVGEGGDFAFDSATQLTIADTSANIGDVANIAVGDVVQVAVSSSASDSYLTGTATLSTNPAMTISAITRTTGALELTYSCSGTCSNTDFTDTSVSFVITRAANTVALVGGLAQSGTLGEANTRDFAGAAAGDSVLISGTQYNDGTYTVVSANDNALVLDGHVTDEELTPSSTVVMTFSRAAVGTCTVTEVTKGTKEADVCSGRGLCDSGTGLCTCYSGYTGENCDSQNAQI